MENKIIYYFLFVILFTSCYKENLNEDETKVEENVNYIKEGSITLGKKLMNPYSLKNMQLAYNSLYKKKKLKESIVLSPTHYYIRFLPSDSFEYNLLKSDTNLVLFSYPLDYEISEGEQYHDPSLPNYQITWQYTKVPVNYCFPNIYYEVLDTLFMPMEINVDSSKLKSKKLFKDIWDELLEESLILTNNLEKNEHKIQLKGSKWNPSATIKVWDDLIKQYIPLVGAKIRVRHFLHWDTELTDANGYAKLESFRYSVNYSIVWERANWDIRDGWYVQAYYNGPKLKGHWELNIDGGKSIKYASIHRAAVRIFYGENLGLPRPISYNTYVHKICYIDDKGTGDYWANVGNGLLPDIRIYGKDPYTGDDKSTIRIFRTTSHEFGHAIQCLLMGNIQFWQVSKIIYESWADAVEWAITNKEYNDLGLILPFYIQSDMDHQDTWPYKNADNAYSPLFIDLIDDLNQYEIYGNNKPNDNVKGYSISQLAQIALKSYGLTSLRDNLKKNKPNNVTDKQIDDLFTKYYEIWK